MSILNRMFSSSVFLLRTPSAFQCITLKSCAGFFRAFVWPVDFLPLLLAQSRGKVPPVALGGLRRGTEPGAASPWGEFRESAPSLLNLVDIVDMVCYIVPWFVRERQTGLVLLTSALQVFCRGCLSLRSWPKGLPWEHRGYLPIAGGLFIGIRAFPHAGGPGMPHVWGQTSSESFAV